MVENKRLIGELVLLFIFLLIVIPICVNASNDYSEREDYLNSFDKVFVDINNNDKISNDSKVISSKIVTISNENKDSIKINLGFRIAKYTNSYTVNIGNRSYNLDTLEYSDDGNYFYYDLGFFEVDNISNLDFSLVLNNDISYDSSVIYSFYVKGI